MNKKVINIAKLAAFFFAGSITAQTMQRSEVKSPESYAFEKYGNVPVNLYTGAIDLTVPVASINENGVKIPVTLSYDSSGFIPHKKNEVAGVNWTLVAGGRITRTLNGTPDEYVGNPNYPGIFGSPRDVHGFLKGVRTNISSNINAYNLYGGTGKIDTNNNTISWTMGPASDPSNAYEGTPDVFSFNMMGISGKFVIGNDGNALVESDDPNIKVDLSQMAMYGGANFCGNDVVSVITIMDGQGNKYIFGGDLSKYELSYYNSNVLFQEGFKGFPTINSFSLSKIIFNDGKTVEFKYYEGSLKYQYDFCHNPNILSGVDLNPAIAIEAYYQEGARSDDWWFCLAPGGPAMACSGGTDGYSVPIESFSVLKKSVLTSIKYDNNEIKINYLNTGYPIKHRYSAPKYLNEWVINNVETYSNSKLIKKTQFSYDHLGGEFKRPFLKSVKDVVSNQEYTFAYNTVYSLPPYYTKGIDHWGYWNGLDGNTSLAPVSDYNRATGDYTLVNTYRDPSLFYFNQGLLNQITYPTKGSTTFEYEPQYYGKRVERNSTSNFLPTLTTNNGFVGGTRIKEIKSFSEGILTSQKEYKYTTALNQTTSSGLLMHWPRYYYYWEFTQQGGFGPEWYKTGIRTSSNIISSSLDSYNVGYSKVFEVEQGKGYTEYDFSTYETHPDQITPDTDNIREYVSSYANIKPVNLYKNFNNLYGIDKSVIRGKLLSQKTYSENDFINPIRKVNFDYTDNIEFNPNNLIDNDRYVSINHMSGKWVQAYKKYMNSSYIKKKTIKDYFNGTEVKTEIEYFYDSTKNLNLSRQIVRNSDNTELKTSYKYLTDIFHGSPNQPNTFVVPYAFLINMFMKNMYSVPLVTTNYKNNIFLNRTQTLYEFNQNNNVLTLPKKQLSYTEDKIVSAFSSLGLPDTNFATEETIYDLYDAKGNIQQYTTKDGVSTTVIWGYNLSHPIATVVGAKLSEINTSLISSIVAASDTDAAALPNNDETLLLQSLKTFRDNLTNYQVTTYTYDPLIGVRSITPPSGIREVYFYDDARRLMEIRENNQTGKLLKEFKYNYKH
ncbi:hypothetical protein [Chryseobacterium sp. JK1]|uniref:hypothetical protein n=1 Tax=Chryseobacterium sp. JK1 TaxID=874294 RepID=UPI003D68D77B